MKEEPQISILIAEDDKKVAESLSHILSERNYEVIIALDGEAALSRLGEKKFDVVILDLRLPKIGGFQILEHIKTVIPSTKVIVLTAFADPRNTAICMDLGADHVMGKPYDIEMLFWSIDMVLSK